LNLQYTCINDYLDTCPKNVVLLCFRKGFCALGLGLELKIMDRVIGLGLWLWLRIVEISGNTFKYVFSQTTKLGKGVTKGEGCPGVWAPAS